ncbi:hypothetical protein [Actinomadura flavalba]|uniref:hypothetical protein n=1 Tax=Actinomadura flavalba TaxID=1120938 RepID=UPI000381006E|nr:hypothetical protein [Actinomadura flavalba]
MDFATSADLALWAALLLTAVAIVRVHRRTNAVAARLPELGLPVGAKAPGLDRLDVAPDGPTLLLFLSSGCGGCPAVLEEALALAAGGRAVPMRLVFSGDPLPMNGAAGLIPIRTGERALLDDYRVPGTPFAVLVEAGRVRRAEPVRSMRVLGDLAGVTPPPGAA